MENSINKIDVSIPMSADERRKWIDHYIKTDPIIASWLDGGTGQDKLESALLAKCAQYDSLNTAFLEIVTRQNGEQK